MMDLGVSASKPTYLYFELLLTLIVHRVHVNRSHLTTK